MADSEIIALLHNRRDASRTQIVKNIIVASIPIHEKRSCEKWTQQKFTTL